MSQDWPDSYTTDHAVQSDGSVDFACSTDPEKWPWLALPPHHPAVLQTQNFWTSIGAVTALGAREEGKWTALTWTDWLCGEPGIGHAVRGQYSRTLVDDQDSFETRLFDQHDREIVRMRGRGVVFRTRNFEQWRTKAKRAVSQASDNGGFAFGTRAELGLTPPEFPLVGVVRDGQSGRVVDGLVTAENGLPPSNPLLSGSGDHVNSTHIAEAARQALHVIEQRGEIEITGGEMTLKRYVELGTPFELNLVDHKAGEIRFDLVQMDRVCSEISLNW